MIGKMSPCFDCDHRAPGCHGECEEYKAWSDSQSKIVDSIKKQKKDEQMLDNFHNEAIRRVEAGKRGG